MRVGRVVLAAVAAVAIAGCGDDDESGGGGGSSSTPAASAAPSTLDLTASGTTKALAYEAPESVKAGVTEITLSNEGEDRVDGQLVRVDGDHPYEEVLAELENATNSKPVAEWFHAAGGVGGVEPGSTGTVTQVLEPGTYHVLGGERPPKEDATFEVTGEASGELPQTDGRVDATEYAFGADGLKAGSGKVTLENKGRQWHHFLASKLKPGTTIEDAKKFFESEGGGPPPFDFEKNAVESTVMDGGVAQVVDAELRKGTYVFFCFISDKDKGGPPHVAKGMVSEVTVD